MKYLMALFFLAWVADAQAGSGSDTYEYGVEDTIGFELWDVTAANVKGDVTPAAADCRIKKDNGNEAQCTNTFEDDGGVGYKITLTGDEMSAKRIRIRIIDADAVDAFLPQTFSIMTAGTSASAHFQDTTATDVWAASTRALTDKTGFALSGTQTFNTTGNITGNLSGSVGSVTSVTDKTGYTAACTLGTDAVTAASVSAAAANKIADHALRRNTSNVEASSDGDTLSRKSLLGATAQQTHRVTVVGDTMSTYRSDGSTLLGTRTITSSSSAAPITGVGN